MQRSKVISMKVHFLPQVIRRSESLEDGEQGLEEPGYVHDVHPTLVYRKCILKQSLM